MITTISVAAEIGKDNLDGNRLHNPTEQQLSLIKKCAVKAIPIMGTKCTKYVFYDHTFIIY